MNTLGTVAFISFNIFIMGFIYIKNNIGGRTNTLASKSKLFSIGPVLWIAFVLRLVLAPLNLHFSSDIGLFSYWSQQGANDLLHIYSNASFLDYPPFYIYILSFIGAVGRLLGFSGGESAYIVLLKLPSILADLATAYILYRLAVKRLAGSWPVAVAALYAFNPAVLIDTAMWGQVDSFLVMLLAAGFYLMDSDRPQLCALPFAAAILTKPQGLILMPVVLFAFLKRRDVKLLLKTLAYGIGTTIILTLPFMIVEGPKWLFDLYLNTASHYNYASLNAFNFFGMVGANLKQDSETFILFSYMIWGFIFIFMTLAYTGLVYIRGKGKHLPYLGGLLLSLGVFVLSVRMHERYMFPVMFFLLAIFVLTKDKWSLIFYGISSITVFANIYVVLEKMLRTGDPHVYMRDQAYGDSVALIIISIINVLLLIAVAIWSWRIGVSGKVSDLPGIGKPPDDEAIEVDDDPIEVDDDPIGVDDDPIGGGSGAAKPEVDKEETGHWKLRLKRKDVIIMAVMTLVYLVIAFINLGGFEVPETQWQAEDLSDGFIIELPEEAYVSRLTYYCGLGENGSYHVWFMDSSGQYQKIDQAMEEDEFYKWKHLDIGAVTRSIRVRTISPGGSLH
ncbi:MAG TPA: glycosyltransferase 87 family protein, partial [Bacillota bacterium]|nr:glycosyltransferase 87 family protein [Bacillota bacterium]